MKTFKLITNKINQNITLMKVKMTLMLIAYKMKSFRKLN